MNKKGYIRGDLFFTSLMIGLVFGFFVLMFRPLIISNQNAKKQLIKIDDLLNEMDKTIQMEEEFFDNDVLQCHVINKRYNNVISEIFEIDIKCTNSKNEEKIFEKSVTSNEYEKIKISDKVIGSYDDEVGKIFDLEFANE